jgi:hypothetical protein
VVNFLTENHCTIVFGDISIQHIFFFPSADQLFVGLDGSIFNFFFLCYFLKDAHNTLSACALANKNHLSPSAISSEEKEAPVGFLVT